MMNTCDRCEAPSESGGEEAAASRDESAEQFLVARGLKP
jgi:hypothetical protein